ncbi:MAG TPA: hypothetical protein VN889_02820 [Solirubrobacteraceae bacterium]|nr:hypothetical protein [Solirubrobacteraceae bacterium]
MLYIALAAGLLPAALVGLAMCRLAALSDRLHTVALSEWVVASRCGAHEIERADGPVEHPAFDLPISAYREAS